MSKKRTKINYSSWSNRELWEAWDNSKNEDLATLYQIALELTRRKQYEWNRDEGEKEISPFYS